jgi:hypothetical protein
VLLRGNAVNYAAKGQDASGLSFGAKTQTQPPRIDEEITRLIGKGVAVSYVAEDAAERGLKPADLIEGVKPVRSGDVAGVFEAYDQVWHW